jgi:uncharacterized membrane protein YcgQ (UPF0703/DUF1980 family)
MVNITDKIKTLHNISMMMWALKLSVGRTILLTSIRTGFWVRNTAAMTVTHRSGSMDRTSVHILKLNPISSPVIRTGMIFTDMSETISAKTTNSF